MVSPIVEYIVWLMFPKYNFIKLFPIFLVQNIILKKKFKKSKMLLMTAINKLRFYIMNAEIILSS